MTIIVIRFEDMDLQEQIRMMRQRLRNPAPIMRAVGVGLSRNTRERFRDGVDPDGVRWAPLNPLYASGKRGPGILRESGMRGGLMGSITFTSGQKRVVIGTNKVYAAIHQFGGVIKAKNGGRLRFQMGGRWFGPSEVTIPERRFLGISREDEQTVEEIFVDAFRPRP